MAQTRLFCLPLVCRLQCTNYLLNTHFKMFRSWSANWILEINNGFLVIFLNCYQDINANNILRYLEKSFMLIHCKALSRFELLTQRLYQEVKRMTD